MIGSSCIYCRYVDDSARQFDDAFPRSLFALPEVFRLDSGSDRPGPTIRIFRLHSTGAGSPPQ